MSYILNALRKSEQERQAKEGPTLENRVMGERDTQKPWKTWLVVALIVINLVTLSFFFFQSRRQPGPETTRQPESKTDDQAVSAVEPESVKKNKKSSAELRREMFQPPDRKKTGKKIPSISESVEKRKSASIKPAPKPTLEEKVSTLVNATNEEGLTVLKRSEIEAATKSSVDTDSAADSRQTPSSSVHTGQDTAGATDEKTETAPPHSRDPASREAKQDLNSRKPDSSNERTVTTSETAFKSKSVPRPKPAVRKKAKPQIPYFEDLPVELRRKFPDLNINVYVFSEEPDESFIMVDMVKYVPGQNITEGMELKDIRHESMVVEYEGRKVRIRRP